MEQERTTWNDQQIDRLADEVRDMRSHLDDRFDALASRIESRFDRLQIAMIVSLASILAAFGGALAAFQV